MHPGIIIYLSLLAVGLLLAANEHGQPKTGTHSFWSHLAAFAITVGLLWWAGVFTLHS